MDLAIENPFANLNEYDLIIINHYRLAGTRYCELQKHLKEDALLWVNGFREVPVDNPRITEKDLLRDADFESIVDCMLESKDIYDNETQKLVRYCWRKHSIRA